MKVNITKLVMTAILMVASFTVKAQTDGGRVYGQWVSHEGQLLKNEIMIIHSKGMKLIKV